MSASVISVLVDSVAGANSTTWRQYLSRARRSQDKPGGGSRRTRPSQDEPGIVRGDAGRGQEPAGARRAKGSQDEP